MEWKIFLTIFVSIFVAEMGDKTQLATFGFAAGTEHSKWLVFAASALALVAASAVAVLFGEAISRYIGERILEIVSGTLFVIIGLWTLKGAL